MSGTFGTVTGTQLSGERWVVTYGSSSVTLTAKTVERRISFLNCRPDRGQSSVLAQSVWPLDIPVGNHVSVRIILVDANRTRAQAVDPTLLVTLGTNC